MIPDGNEKGIKANTTLSENIIVEKAEVICDATHPDWSDFTIKLISPSGTESVLANPIPQTPNSSGSDEIVPDSSQWKFMLFDTGVSYPRVNGSYRLLITMSTN
jgi:subtilisin-like proprotein convertase family protein